MARRNGRNGGGNGGENPENPKNQPAEPKYVAALAVGQKPLRQIEDITSDVISDAQLFIESSLNDRLTQLTDPSKYTPENRDALLKEASDLIVQCEQKVKNLQLKLDGISTHQGNTDRIIASPGLNSGQAERLVKELGEKANSLKAPAKALLDQIEQKKRTLVDKVAEIEKKRPVSELSKELSNSLNDFEKELDKKGKSPLRKAIQAYNKSPLWRATLGAGLTAAGVLVPGALTVTYLGKMAAAGIGGAAAGDALSANRAEKKSLDSIAKIVRAQYVHSADGKKAIDKGGEVIVPDFKDLSPSEVESLLSGYLAGKGMSRPLDTNEVTERYNEVLQVYAELTKISSDKGLKVDSALAHLEKSRATNIPVPAGFRKWSQTKTGKIATSMGVSAATAGLAALLGPVGLLVGTGVSVGMAGYKAYRDRKEFSREAYEHSNLIQGSRNAALQFAGARKRENDIVHPLADNAADNERYANEVAVSKSVEGSRVFIDETLKNARAKRGYSAAIGALIGSGLVVAGWFSHEKSEQAAHDSAFHAATAKPANAAINTTLNQNSQAASGFKLATNYTIGQPGTSSPAETLHIRDLQHPVGTEQVAFHNAHKDNVLYFEGAKDEHGHSAAQNLAEQVTAGALKDRNGSVHLSPEQQEWAKKELVKIWEERKTFNSNGSLNQELKDHLRFGGVDSQKDFDEVLKRLHVHPKGMSGNPPELKLHIPPNIEKTTKALGFSVENDRPSELFSSTESGADYTSASTHSLLDGKLAGGSVVGLGALAAGRVEVVKGGLPEGSPTKQAMEKPFEEASVRRVLHAVKPPEGETVSLVGRTWSSRVDDSLAKYVSGVKNEQEALKKLTLLEKGVQKFKPSLISLFTLDPEKSAVQNAGLESLIEGRSDAKQHIAARINALRTQLSGTQAPELTLYTRPEAQETLKKAA
jgi:hypothetical protein